MADILDQVRQDPEKALQAFDFYFDATGFNNVIVKKSEDETGGPCTFTPGAPSKQGISTVKIANGGPDYFFPWVPRGVGSVVVPIAAPDGTIVATGQLNGCTFEVIQAGDKLHFYHDGDSKYLRKTVQPVAGNQVCVVAPADYMPGNLGGILMGITQQLASKTKEVTKTRAYCYQLFAVKHGGTWKVFSCGLLIFNGAPTDGFKERSSKLVASFSPAATVRPRAATI